MLVYRTLQKLISQIVVSVHSGLVQRLNESVSDVAKQIAAILDGRGELSLRQIRLSARNFTSVELAKKLVIHRHFTQWVPEVSAALTMLVPSQKNQQHFAERVDYYGAKLTRQSIDNQRLYLLCYLQQRWQQAQERSADGFVHHVRHAKQKATQYTQEPISKDWRKAEKNVSKAAEVLPLFVDEQIDERQPFGAVRQTHCI